MKCLSSLVLLILFSSISCLQEMHYTDMRSHRKPGSGSQDPYCQAIALKRDTFNLASADQSFLKSWAKKLINELPSRISSDVNIVADLETLREFSAGIDEGKKQTVAFKFKVDEVPFCHMTLKAHGKNKRLISFGRLPNFKNLKIGPSTQRRLPYWEHISLVLPVLEDALKKQGAKAISKTEGSELSISRASKCLGISKKGTLEAFWDLSFYRENLAYRSIVNSSKVFIDERGREVLAEDSFHASGKGLVYSRVKANAGAYQFTKKAVNFTNISEGSYLCNRMFVTDDAANKDKDFSFSKPADRDRLIQVTTFHNATVHAEWLMSLPAAKGWPAPQISLSMTNDPKEKNNANYNPGIQPSIMLGPGDGIVFSNLRLDPEVVAHEVGHHLVFQSVTEVFGESRVLHEAITDIFVFVRTQDPNLGDTICLPTSGQSCSTPSALRTALNDKNYLDPDLSRGPYAQAELLTAYMWDLGGIMGYEEMANLVLYSLNFLISNSGLEDFFVALKMADIDLTKGKYLCAIEKTAKARGYTEFVIPLKCKKD